MGIKLDPKSEIVLPTIDYPETVGAITRFIEEQVLLGSHDGVVLGVSGGIDSATVLFLARSWMDSMHGAHFRGSEMLFPKRRVLPMLLPGTTSTKADCDLGLTACRNAGLTPEIFSVGPVSKALIEDVALPISKYDYGNMQSGLRAQVLWLRAAQENLIVLGTGNADEDFGVGYYTLRGDGLVSCSPIGKLSKRLVYNLALWLGVPKEIYMREPTAALEPDQTDLKDLGYNYLLVETVMESMHDSDLLKRDVVFADRQLAVQLFDLQPKYRDLSDGVQRAIEDVISRHGGAIYKSNIINPPKCPIKFDYSCQ